MRVYLTRKTGDISATGEYNPATKSLTVLKGSRVSAKIAYSEKFRGAKTIEKNRLETVVDSIVTKDIVFKSSSTAANFVTGSSTNGLTAWKNEAGHQLNEVIAKLNDGRLADD